MNTLHYPPQTGPADDRIVGIGAHTEYVICYYFFFFYHTDGPCKHLALRCDSIASELYHDIHQLCCSVSRYSGNSQEFKRCRS
jgi:hypothetical protein